MEDMSETIRNGCEVPIEPESTDDDDDLKDEPMPLADFGATVRRTLRSSRRETPSTTSAPPQAKKRTYSIAFEDMNPEKYYLSVNKKLKRSAHIHLETIFEEPDKNIENFTPLGTRKINRALSFPNPTLSKANKTKTKKRMAKVKKHFATKRKVTKVSHEQFINKMESLQKMLD